MPRGKGKKSTKVDNQDNGVLKLIPFNPDIIEDSNKKPNYMLDEFVGVCVDSDENHELMKIKQVTVTEDNIKSTTNVYEDKYKIGDTYQEWTTMGKYLHDYISSAECYAKLMNINEISKLAYCKDVNKLVEINEKINSNLQQFAMEYTAPKVAKELNEAFNQLFELQKTMQKYKDMTNQLVKECDDLMEIVAEKRAKMVSKGIIDNKKTNHKIKEEKE